MRLDIYLTQNGYAESRSRAKDLIEKGLVSVNGIIREKPSWDIPEQEFPAVEIIGEVLPYVSRGGIKLKAALDGFGIDVTGKIAADIGASSGGFTDCLLQSGIQKVYAIDSGKNQLHSKIASNGRVVSMEGCNARYLTLQDIGEMCDIVVMDVSFISQTLLYDAVLSILKEDGIFVSLIKPQFEAGSENIGKNGIVKNKKIHFSVIRNVTEKAKLRGLYCQHIMNSPITGGDGNREFLGCFKRMDTGMTIDSDSIEKILNQPI